MFSKTKSATQPGTGGRTTKVSIGLAAALCVLMGFWAGNTPLFGQEKVGALNGTVTDTTGGVVPGTTVTVTNKVTNLSRATVTASGGTYEFKVLDPGGYSVTFEKSGLATLNYPDINIEVGQTLKLDATMKVGEVLATVVVTDVVPMIDTENTLLAHNISEQEFTETPKTRTFQSLALTSPGVNSGDIEGGIQVNGASGAENSYIVDGTVTTSPLEGQSRQNTVFEYLQEVQVKTNGIDAEYGGALGGVISAVTKTGGAEFHGEAHYYYSGNSISAGPIQRLQLSPVDEITVFHLQDTKQPLNRHEPGGSVGGPILKNRLFFFGSFSPQIVRQSRNYLFSNGTQSGSIWHHQENYQGFGKLSYQAGKLSANFSTLLTPTRDLGKLPAFNGTLTNSQVSPLSSFQFNQGTGYAQNQYNMSANVDYAFNARSLVSLRGGYFSDNYMDSGISTTTSYTYEDSAIGLPNIPQNLQQPMNFSNLPRTQITFFDRTQTPFGNLDYNQTFHAAGSHVLKGGVGLRRTINNVNSTYPGGYVFIFWDQSVKGADGVSGTGTYGYYQVNDFGTRGKVGANIVSLYVQDAWKPFSRLTLNLGLRTENEKLPTFRSDIQKYAFQFGFGDKLAPRLGAAYDLRGDGKIKLSGSWGRYYDWTKYELARGSFGGDFWHRYYRSLDTLAIDTLNINNMPGNDLWRSATGYRDLRLTSISNTDPNIKPMYQDDFYAGVDYQLNNTSVLGVHYIHNALKRTIEDFSALIDGNNVYRIGNPGEGTSTIYPASYPAFTANFPMPKPQRQYDAMEISFSRRFAQRWFLNANYTLSRLYGNYPGLANSDEISTPTTGFSSGTTQQQAGSIARPGSNSNSAYDTDTLLWDSHGHLNVVGRLPTDRPNVFKLYGSYMFPTNTQIGAFFYAGNGTPISTQVNSLDDEGLFVNGRGDLGRTPGLSHTDLMVSHEIKTGEGKRLRFELDLQNVFNQKTPTHLFNFLNKGAPGQGSTIPADAIDMSMVNLAQGYNYTALLSQTSDAQNGITPYDNRYKQPDLWNAGMAGQFLIKFIF